MKTTILSKVTAGLLALGLLLAPIQGVAAPYYFWWQVVDEYGNKYPSQTVSCSVYDLASHGAKILYLQPSLAPHAGVQTSMPLLSDANSRLHFYSDSNADIRVVCYYARGGAATDLRLSVNTHNVMIDRQGRKVVRFPFSTNATVTRTGVWLPSGSIVRDILVQNTFYGSQDPQTSVSAEGITNTAPHLNVGFAGDHAWTYHALIDRMHLYGQPLWVRPGNSGTGRIVPKTGGVGAVYHFGASGGFGVHRGIALAASCRGAVSGPAGNTESCPYTETPAVIHQAAGLELVYQTSNAFNSSGHVYVIYESYHVGVSTQPIQ